MGPGGVSGREGGGPGFWCQIGITETKISSHVNLLILTLTRLTPKGIFLHTIRGPLGLLAMMRLGVHFNSLLGGPAVTGGPGKLSVMSTTQC